MQKHKKLLLLILFAAFLKELTWAALVPLWHFPDEQSHFAQAAFIAEKGGQPQKKVFDLTEEIRISETLLGTERDSSEKNRFTFHPEYRILYSKNYTGIYEKEIISLAQNPEVRQMKKFEASRYPPLYYFFISIVYKIFYNNDLFIRVFLSRILQLAFYICTVILSFKIGRLLFPKSSLAIVLSISVAFHPMFSFVSAGINSDNFGNFAFSLFIFVALSFLKGMFSFKNIFALLLVSFFTIFIKPQFYITLPIVLLLVIYKFIKSPLKIEKKMVVFFVFTVFFIIIWLTVNLTGLGPGLLKNAYTEVLNLKALFSHFKDYALPHLYREVMPWYWGIFNWLGVTYPRIVHRVINWIVLIALMGFVGFFIRNIKKVFSWPMEGIFFLILVNLFFVFGVYYFDWQQFILSGYKFHLGVQGRYFFPLIITHMFVLLLGWREIFRFLPKLYAFSLKLLVLLFFLFHGLAFIVVTSAYYDLSSFSVFIIQASQYKPWFFKGGFLVLILFLSITTNLFFLLKYCKKKDIYDKKGKVKI